MKRGSADAVDQLVEQAQALYGGEQTEAARAEPEAAPPRDGRPDILRDCFPEQVAFIKDHSSFKWALTTRRAAKTYSVGLQMIDDSFDYPGATYLFISLTKEAARRQFWKDVLLAIDRKHKLGAEFLEGSLTMRMPNGSEIQILGADQDEGEKNKFLGGKYRIVAIDEAAAFTIDLREMVEAVLSPAVVDLNGQIILTSTPSNLYQGYFKECTNGSTASYLSPPEMREPGWSGHVWRTEANPFVATAWIQQCERLKSENPLIIETKSWQQMREGRWVVVEDELVYRFSRSRNSFTELPRYTGGAWHFAISCDLGYTDASGLLLGAWHDWDRHLYLLKSWKEWKTDISTVVSRVHMLEDEVRSEFGEEIETYLVDGANRMAVEEMRKRFQIGFLPADKRGKEDFIELMNDEWIARYILVNLEGCSGGILNSGRKSDSLDFATEVETLTWHPKHKTPGQRKEFHPPLENALCDCALYLWRFAYTYLADRPPVPPAQPGTPEYFDAVAQAMWECEIEAMREADEQEEPQGLSEWFEGRDPRFETVH